MHNYLRTLRFALLALAGLGVAQAIEELPARVTDRTWWDRLSQDGLVVAVPDSVDAIAETYTSFALGFQMELNGRADDALKHYEAALEITPDDPELLSRRAACMLEKREFEECWRSASLALARDSLYAEALWLSAAGLVGMGRVESAIAPLRGLVAQRPDRRALNLLVNILERLKRDGEALEPLTALVRLSPSPRQHERRAAMLLRLGRHEEALEEYYAILEIAPEYPILTEVVPALLRDLGRREEIADFFRALTEKDPMMRAAWQRLVEEELHAGAWEAAETDLLRLRQLFPDEGLPILQLGLIAYRNGEIERAFELITEAAAQQADPKLVALWRMRIYFAQGVADSALQNANALIALSPDAAEAWRIRALCQAEGDKFDEALVSVSRWAELGGENDIEPLLLGATICREWGQWGQGIHLMRRALARAPDHEEVLLDYAIYLEMASQYEEAEGAIRRILARHPESAVALNFLGYMWIDQGVRLEEAEDLIKRALKIEPKNPAFLDSLGWLWYKRGDLAEAERWLDRAIEHGGRHPEIYQHMAQIKVERDKAGEARRILELGLKWFPEDVVLQEFLRSLE